ncbi:hypothetical protein Q4543_15655 [Salipiger sp. 1_MG-2023]|uniref:hypothetical protein n=1 Tax=Salipiger sp. 1_MG-2023 TaxID=3062665 RepID=UPI0026E1DDCF|nr:hypothetical protein [Salipiger sp. 1_MG-2023]MDO6586948.1 hypothetical protein [Salipiger sp. 1_MG-2023]
MGAFARIVAILALIAVTIIMVGATPRLSTPRLWGRGYRSYCNPIAYTARATGASCPAGSHAVDPVTHRACRRGGNPCPQADPPERRPIHDIPTDTKPPPGVIALDCSGPGGNNSRVDQSQACVGIKVSTDAVSFRLAR